MGTPGGTPATTAQRWDIETLEPRLLMSADLAPAPLHSYVMVEPPAPPADTAPSYVFHRGDGVMTLGSDAPPNTYNILEFAGDIRPDEVSIARIPDQLQPPEWGNYGGALQMSVGSGGDRVVSSFFFVGDDPVNAQNHIQQVRFASDGAVWTLQTLVDMAMQGTSGNDQLVGTTYDDTLDGGAGDDQLGDYAGNNTYLFGKGDGQDVIASYGDSTVAKLNTLQFKSGVTPEDVQLARPDQDGAPGTALVATIASTGESVTIESFFADNNPGNVYNPVQQIRFADGTTWDLATLAIRAGAGGGGTTGNDVLAAADGNGDLLAGGDGDDGLTGGAGADAL
ncbi:MAG: LEPR-XLL domain-containing protein, partial [Burkholderiales bacterium]|nr:LEPR-XLL domain-containing protein [Burkholderiales bacterium]